MPTMLARYVATVPSPNSMSAQAAVGAMAAGGGGSIINLTSISARSCYPGNGPYSASKAALENLGRQAAVEFAPHGIRVNSISPGWVRTALTEHVYQHGRKFLPQDLALRVNGRPLDPQPYLDYLHAKFGALYHL